MMMRRWLGIVGMLWVAWTHAVVVRDVQWRCEVKSCFLEFDFDPALGLPSFFQKYDAQSQELKIAFASAATSARLGEYPIQENARGLRALSLRQENTAAGTPLLVFAWKVGADIAGAKNDVSLVQGHLFRVLLPTRSPSRAWSLRRAKPVEKQVAVVAAPVIPEKNIPEKNKAPEITSTAQKSANLPSAIARVEWVRGFGVEQFALELERPAAVSPRYEGDSVVVWSVEQLPVLPAVVIGGSSLVSTMRIVKGALNSGEIRLSLKRKDLHLQVRGARLLLQGTVPVSPRLESWAWIQGRTEQKVFQNKDPDAVGEDLEQFARSYVQRPAYAQTFALRRGARDLIVVAERDGVLRESPRDDARVLQKLPFGTRLQSLEQVNPLYYKVKMGDILGYVNRRDVSYPDELSVAQTEKMQRLAAENAADSLSGIGVVFEEETADRISYQSFGRRDPFIPLQGVVNEGINIDGVELVGIIWEAEVPMVLLSDTRNPGVSYTLKEGDAVLNGKVLKITREEVLFLINEGGVSRRYTMTLPNKYGGKR